MQRARSQQICAVETLRSGALVDRHAGGLEATKGSIAQHLRNFNRTLHMRLTSSSTRQRTMTKDALTTQSRSRRPSESSCTTQVSQSRSLMTQMGLKDQWRWRDTGEEIDPANLLATFTLVKLQVSWEGPGDRSVTTFLPWLDEYPRSELSRISAFSRTPISRDRGTPLAFSRWWRRPVIKDFGGNAFARADLVLKVANQDGGAHIDPRVSGEYVDLSRGGSLSLPVEEEDGSLSLSTESPVPATLRQIAFEIIQTFEH